MSRIALPVRAEEPKAEDITSLMPFRRVVHWLLLATTVLVQFVLRSGPIHLASAQSAATMCAERYRRMGEHAKSGGLEHTTATYIIYTHECAFFSCNLSLSRSMLVCIARGSRVSVVCLEREGSETRERK